MSRTPPAWPRRFSNLDPAHRPHRTGTVLRWALVDRLRGRRRRSPARAPVPVVENDGAALRDGGGGASLTWIGHATWLVQVGGANILTDPVFGDLLGGVIRRNVAPGLTPEQLPPIDAVVVSHNHYDHLDRRSIEAIGTRAEYFVPARMGRWFRRLGLERVREMSWWQSAGVKGATVTFVPARHWSRRSFWDTNRSLWGGFVLQGSGRSAYFAGDTAYFEGFREIGARFPRLDAALLPIGAYDPEWFMRPQHMNPDDAVQAFLDLGADLCCPMHWGTFKLTDEPLDEPPELFAQAWERFGRGGRWLAAIGETRWLE